MTIRKVTHDEYDCDRCSATDVASGKIVSFIYGVEYNINSLDIDTTPIDGYRMDVCIPCFEDIKYVIQNSNLSVPLKWRKGDLFFDEMLVVYAKNSNDAPAIEGTAEEAKQHSRDLKEDTSDVIEVNADDLALTTCTFPRCKYNSPVLHSVGVHMARKHQNHSKYEHYRRMLFPTYRRTVTVKTK